MVFSQHFFPETNAPALRLRGHVSEWISRGHEVTIISSFPTSCSSSKLHIANKFFQTEIIDGAKVIRVYTWRGRLQSKLNRYLRYGLYFIFAILALRRVKGVELILSTSPDLLCGFAGFVAKKFLKKPWLLEIRDIWPESIRAVGAIRSGVLLRGLEILEQKMYQRADKVVAVTDTIAAHIEQIRKRNDVLVVRNATDTNFFASGRFTIESSFDVQLRKKFVVSYCGTFGLSQDLKMALCCAEKFLPVDDIVFVFMGDGVERDSLISYASELELSNVIFFKRSSREAVRDLYMNSDVSLVCLRNDPVFESALPSKMFEAMAMECPIMISAKGESAKIIKASNAGYISEPGDPDALFECIKQMKNNRDELQAMGKRGRAYVLKHHSREINAKKFANFIETTFV